MATGGSESSHGDQWDVTRWTGESHRVEIQQTPSNVQPLLVKLLLSAIPREYDNDKKWGGTKEVFDGVHVKFDNGKLKTKRKTKKVNHGTWKRYRIELMDPHERLTLTVDNLEEFEEGKFRFNLRMAARLQLYGRLQEWNRGLRLFSISADAWSDVELAMKCEMSTSLDPTKLPPDLLLQPRFVDAELKLVQFKLERLSHADGPVIRELGDGLEDLLRKELQEKNQRLAVKLNRQVDKHQDDLRLSVTDWMKQAFFSDEKTASETGPAAEQDSSSSL